MPDYLENQRERFRPQRRVPAGNLGAVVRGVAADAGWDSEEDRHAFFVSVSSAETKACLSVRAPGIVPPRPCREQTHSFAEIPGISLSAVTLFIGVQIAAAMLAGFRIAEMTAQPWPFMVGSVLILFLDLDAVFFLWSHRRRYPEAGAPALWLASLTITPGLAVGVVPYAFEIIFSCKF